MSDGSIEQFVRGVLGCRCPAEVFRSVLLEDNPRAFADLAPVRLLRIGGRLLILLLETRERDALELPLEQLFFRGRQLRDTERYNRFRLVVAVPVPGTAAQLLAERFAELDGRDERLHLHVVGSGQLPQALASSLPHAVQQ